MAGRIQEFQAAALALEGYERADERANPGAVHLSDADEIDEDVGRAGFGELSQFRAQLIIAGAYDNAALQIENGDSTGFPPGNLQAHDSLLRNARCTVKRMTPWPLILLREYAGAL